LIENLVKASIKLSRLIADSID